jgi:hypothetical protein
VALGKKWAWAAVFALLVVQAVQVAFVVHRESLTFDEDNHIFAGYMMHKTGDYGLNPEHPPLVKLFATLPLLGRNLWTPPLQSRDFKTEAYLDGRDFLARNDGPGQRLVFRMRLTAGLLALALALVVFFAAREWFGTGAGLIALLLFVFDPNILANSALVTTDIGVSLFFLLGIYAFYRYVKQPSLLRLLLAGIAAGLLLATKHSGILLAPMLLLLIAWEILCAPKGTRGRLVLRLTGAFAAIVIIGVLVLWSFYGFRYAARPDGLLLSTSLEKYAAPLSHFNASVVLGIARLHLLPESYLMGLVDVKRMAEFYPTFIFGKVYPHGQWWYFPILILIKTTLGLLALVALAFFAILTGRLRQRRELAFVLVPCVVYLGSAILAGMNIGARHILPLYVFLFILAGAGIVALSSVNRRWAWLGAAPHRSPPLPTSSRTRTKPGADNRMSTTCSATPTSTGASSSSRSSNGRTTIPPKSAGSPTSRALRLTPPPTASAATPCPPSTPSGSAAQTSSHPTSTAPCSSVPATLAVASGPAAA